MDLPDGASKSSDPSPNLLQRAEMWRHGHVPFRGLEDRDAV